MADTNFQPGTVVQSSWLDDVNTVTYTILNSVTGTNAITANGPSTVSGAYPRGVAFRFIPQNANTGAVTINVNGIGVVAITKYGANPLVAGDLIVGSWAYIAFDGTRFQLVNPGIVDVAHGGTGVTTSAAAPWNAGRLLNVQVFGTPGATIYTPTTGTTRILVRGQGAGGAGGGAAATGGGTLSVGSGGAAGGIGETFLTAGFSGVTVTIGAGGVPAGGANGGAGGSSSFGGFLTLPGGGGGFVTAAAAIAGAGGGAGGLASGGNIINSRGQSGEPGVATFASTFLRSGGGGDSILGGGGVATFQFTGGGAAAAAGNNSSAPGSGGSGGVSTSGGGAVSGGGGSAGIIFVYEYS